jgi:BirA family biotin operon repressor/biotin-[acetyl-CoA-carboxylase] ligase
MIYFFDEIPSTIDEARDEKYCHGDVIVADHQTAGRGQRGHKWASPRGENLMFSAVLDTRFLLVTEQFLLLQTVALALTDMLATYGIDSSIKWTNDIYVGDRKITGVLIDHTIRDGRLARSGVGVGINVNQTNFEEWLPNPTSMKLCSGLELDRRDVLERFMECLTARYEMLKGGQREQILADYHSKIYRLNIPAQYELPDGKVFTGVIRGIKPSGDLIIEDACGTKCFLFREVQFVI